MEQARDVIETLAQQEGVNLAMIVSRDGFILEIEAARETLLDPETVGAAVSTYWATVDSMGSELEAGIGSNGLLEYKNAMLSTSLVANDELILTVVTDKNINPATIRYLTIKFSQLLDHLL